MKTKTIFLWLLLAMLVGGVNVVWAENTFFIKFMNSSSVTVYPTGSNYFTYNKGEGNNVEWSGKGKHSCTYEGESYSNVIKMENETQCVFTVSAGHSATVTIVQTTSNNGNYDATDKLKFDNSNLTSGLSNTTVTKVDNHDGEEGDKTYNEYVITNVSAGGHTITRQSETGLAYVKVVEHNYSYPDPTVQTYPHTWDFTTSSADWGTTSTQVVSYDDWRAGSNDNPCTYYVTGTAGESRGFNIDVLKGLRCQSYWLGVDWGYGHIYATAGSITIPSVPANYRIVFTMEGRETGRATNMTTSQATPVERSVSSTDTKHTTYTFDVSSAGDVTFNFDGAISVKSIEVTSSTFTGVYSPTTTNDLNVGTYDADKGGWVIDDNVRNLSGTYTFTGAGAIDSGTEIEEVPGIKMTLGKIGSEYAWAVNSSLKATIPSLAETAGAAVTRDQYDHYNPTDKAFLKFEPYVNGYLTMNGTWYGGENGSTKGVFQKSDGTELRTISATSTSDDITVVLEAGATYYFYCQNYPLQIHSFTFRPAFLEVDQTTGNLLYTLDENNNRIYTEASKDISDPYKSDLSKDPTRFPRLIQSANNYVKFADKPVTSEIEHLVNIATNNDVTLLENGKTLMKGTVSCAIPNRDLFTYYYLQSNILTLEETYRQKGEGSVTEIADQEYVNQSDIANGGYYQFEFSDIISPVSGSKPAVYFKRIGTDSGEWDLRNYQGGANLSISGTKVLVKFDDLEEGTTVKLRIPSSSVMLTDDNNARNPEIIRYFTIKKENEPEVKLIYPTSVASVATSIVVRATRSDGAADGVNDSKHVEGILRGPGIGENGMEIQAFFDNNNIIFKPTSALTANSTYTLEIESNQIYMKGTPEEKVTMKKEFTFTTGASSGTMPIVTTKVPADGAEVSVGAGTVSFTFNQDVTIEPYSRVNVIPINGSEATASGTSRSKDLEGSWELKKLIDGNNRVVGFTYGEDGLKYDMYFEAVLTANTVTGAGGKANERTTIRFKVKPASGYTVDDGYNFKTNEGYPYTWDVSDMKSSDITNIKNDWVQQTDGSYGRANQNNCYGMELSSTKAAYTKMDDLRGIRITQTKIGTNAHVRFLEIETPSRRALRLHGNTNYMCIPNVPTSVDAANGEHLLYIEAQVSNNGVLALNCPSEMAEWVGDAPKGSDGKKVYKIRVKRNAETADGFAAYSDTYGRDIPLVCSDVNIYKIAYSTYNKTLTSGGEGYATDAHDYHNNVITDKGVDYSMTATLDGQTVTPYYVSAISGGSSTAAGTVTLTQITDGVPYSSGVVLIGTANTTFPVFATSYSKPKADLSGDKNKLIGVTRTVTLEQATSNVSNYYYVLNNRYEEVVGGSGSNSEDLIGRTGSHIGFYLMRGGESLTMNPHAAYFTTNTKQFVQGGEIGGVSAARSVYFFRFEDENGNDITGIAPALEEGVADRISQGDGNYYDLRGQRITRPSVPGIYVRNGKKIYVK